jgi:TRAP-type uncharacterized transport system fused permease subunit
MLTINLQDTLSIIVAVMAVLGVVALSSGIFVLFRKVMGDELRVIASQTARLAQKGITDEITGLVGNASALLEALNSLVKTTTGVGVFLTLIGFILLVVAYYLGLQP